MNIYIYMYIYIYIYIYMTVLSHFYTRRLWGFLGQGIPGGLTSVCVYVYINKYIQMIHKSVHIHMHIYTCLYISNIIIIIYLGRRYIEICEKSCNCYG
jgi:hypothetical protein